MRYAAMIVLALIAALAPAVRASTNWLELRHVGKGVLYDYDRDGCVEIITPEGVIEGAELVKGPYPHLNVTLVDVNGDGIDELVFYGGGRVYVYDGETLLKEFKVPDAEPVITPRAVSFGNVIIWRNELYTIGGVTRVVPVVARGKLYALYLRGGALSLLDVLSGEERIVYPDKFRPLYGVAGDGYVDILAASPADNLAVIRYYFGGGARVSVYTVTPEAVIGYDPASNEFYVKAEGRLYRVGATGLLLVSDWEPVSWERSYVYLYSGGELIVYDYMMRRGVAELRLPAGTRPETVFGYPRTVVSYSDRSYLLVGGPAPRVTFIGSPSVYAGEAYTFKVVSNVNYTVMVDGAPGNTTWVFKRPGVHNITVVATSGVVTRRFTFKVYVSPRPLLLSVRVVEPPRIFGALRLSITTVDALNGTVVHVPCTVRVNGGAFNGTSGYEMVIPVGMIHAGELRVEAVCGGGVYETSRKTFYVPVRPAPAVPVVSYLGGGRVEIRFYVGNTSVPVNGTAEVYMEGGRVYRGRLPIVIKLPVGNNTLKVELYPSVPTVMRASYTLNIVYAGDVYTAPSIPGYRVIVADKVINETKIVYRNQTTTVEVPRYIRVKELDAGAAVAALAAGVAAGIPAGIAATRVKKRGAAGEDSVEFEEA